MALIPFIFFLALTIWWWKTHHGLDVCTYMTSLYTLCSLCAFILIASNEVEGSGILWDGWNVEIRLLPTLFFCVLLGTAIFPFSYIHLDKIKTITNPAPWAFLIFSGVLIVCALLNLYLVADSTMDILKGDIKFLRDAHYNGDMSPAEIKAESLPYALRLMQYLNYTTILALPLAFYYLCIDKKIWLGVALGFSSLTSPILGIQSVDRTEIVFWGLMFIYVVIFFYRFLTTRLKVALSIVTLVLGITASIYVFAVSSARFEDTDNGTGLSMFQYGAQGYLNFCYFSEYADFSQIASEREFPLLNHYLLHIDSNAARRSDRSSSQGFFISVFPTFAGDIMLDIGPVGVTIWILAFVGLTIAVIRYKNRTELSLWDVLMLFAMAIIPIFGIFYYRYHNFTHNFMFLILGVLYLCSNYKIVWSKDENCNGHSNI